MHYPSPKALRATLLPEGEFGRCNFAKSFLPTILPLPVEGLAPAEQVERKAQYKRAASALEVNTNSPPGARLHRVLIVWK